MTEGGDADGAANPAAIAAASPERAGADAAVRAVGVGPGDPEFLVPRGERAIREADALVGFETVVDLIRDLTDAETFACGYDDEREALSAFAARVREGATGTAVLMGDPNHSGYQFLGKVEDAVDRPVRVVPGISSLQVAASRARTPMERTTFVTLHRSGDLAPDLRRLRRDVGDRHLLVLPRPFDWMPGEIAAHLLDAGADPALEALVLERLTRDDEAITEATLADVSAHAGGTGREGTPFSDLSVLAVRER